MNSIVSEPLAERECPDEPRAGLGSSEFAELYTEHSRAIYYLCLRLLGEPEKAEDATHDVFLKVPQAESVSGRILLAHLALPDCDQPLPQPPSRVA